MGLIDHEDDVVTVIERLRNLGKFKDLGDDNLAGIRLQQPRQLRAGICRDQIRHVCHGECTENLSAQVNAVIDNDDRRRIQFLHHAQLLRGKDHQQGLAAALEVPDQTLLRITDLYAVDDQVRALILLIAAHDFDLAVVLIGGEERKVPEQIEDNLVTEHAGKAALYLEEIALFMGNTGIPRPPERHRRTDGAIAIALAVRGEVEDIGHKHLRDGFLIFQDVLRAVHPADGGAHRGLHLANGDREAVDQQHDVQTLAAMRLRIYPLVGDDKLIVVRVIVIEEPDADGTAILVKREGVFLENELLEPLILRDQIVRLHRGDQRAQPVDHGIRILRLFGDARIETDQRGLHHGFHHDLGFLAGKGIRGDVCPAVCLSGGNHHVFNLLFCKIRWHVYPSIIL